MPERHKTAIQLRELGLSQVRFERLGPLIRDATEEVEAQFGLEASLGEDGTLNFEMTVRFHQAEVFEGSVGYFASFYEGETPEGGGSAMSTEQWQFFAAKVAPTVVYPYIRETFTNLTTKSGLPPFVIPIVNFSEMFDPQALVLEGSE